MEESVPAAASKSSSSEKEATIYVLEITRTYPIDSPFVPEQLTSIHFRTRNAADDQMGIELLNLLENELTADMDFEEANERCGQTDLFEEGEYEGNVVVNPDYFDDHDLLAKCVSKLCNEGHDIYLDVVEYPLYH